MTARKTAPFVTKPYVHRATGTWAVIRHGGRSSDEWVVRFESTEREPAERRFEAMHEAMR